ncbi:MAG: MFS transporter [Methylohalobius sp.]|nr:MFS transporter [Methylohalobius sp.]
MSERLRLLDSLSYGCLGLPLALLGLPLYVYLPTYYARDLMLGPATVGGILMASRILDVFTDPVAGWISDRLLPGNWRRRGMLIAGAPILLGGIWMLFLPPDGASSAWLLIGTTLACLGWTLVDIPHAAWIAELSENYYERSLLATTREGFRVLGVFLTLALPLATGTSENLGTVLRQLLILVMFSLPLAVAIAVLTLSEPSTAFRSPSWIQSVNLLWGNRPLRRLLLAYLLDGLANGLPATLFLLFTTQRLAIPEPLPLLLLYFGAGVLGVPLWLKLARKVGKHRAWAVSLALAALSFLPVPWLGPQQTDLFIVTVALTGLTLGGDMALPVAMQADVVDADTAAGGGMRAGLLFGIWSMTTKFALALSVGIAFPLLEIFGYNPKLSYTPDLTLCVLAWLYAGLPAVLKTICIGLVWHFPIDAKAQVQAREQIRRLLQSQNEQRRKG